MGIAHLTRIILRFLVFGAVGSFLSTGQALAWNIGTPTVTPNSLVVGVAMTVTVSAVIADPAVVPGSVILQSVDASGHLIAILGALHDDGVKGDAVAGDHRYTIQTNLTEATATTLYLRVAARFPGSRHRRFSSVITVPVLVPPPSSSLYPGQRYPVGSGPHSVAMADVNGDGRLDVVTANYNFDSNDVSVLLSNGDGTFQAEQRFAAGDNPSSVAVADVNGDGRLDVVTANEGHFFESGPSGDVSVLLGNGDGTFQAPQHFAVGLGPYSVAVADVNGDGRLDVLTANIGYLCEGCASADVSVVLGNGDGTFQAEQRFAVGFNPRSMAVADVNGDGRLDVLTANFDSANVSVLLGNGEGAFQAEQHFAVGANPQSVAVADVNGDGRLDVVTANFDSADVSVLLGNGDGTFPAAEQRFGVGFGPNSVAVGDVNGDGRLDLVTANGSGDVSVVLGNGDGTFQAQQRFTVGIAPVSVAVGDVNGDGRLDVVTANYGFDDGSSGDVSVLLGNGDGTFQAQQRFAVGRLPRSVAVGDVNGDGRLDLVTANYGSFDVSVLLGNGKGAFQAEQRFAVGALPTSVAVADVSGNGLLDVVTANIGSSDVSVLLGKGKGAFTYPIRVGVGAGPQSVAVADVNGDGRLDVVTANTGSSNVSVLLSKGKGAFAAEQSFAVGRGPTSVAVADVNGDGRLDVVTANGGSNDVSVLLHQ